MAKQGHAYSVAGMELHWNDPLTWAGRIVPDGAFFVTLGQGGSNVFLDEGSSYAVDGLKLDFHSYLTLNGHLTTTSFETKNNTNIFISSTGNFIGTGFGSVGDGRLDRPPPMPTTEDLSLTGALRSFRAFFATTTAAAFLSRMAGG